MTSDTAALIALLEAATGPSRELDARINAAIHWPHATRVETSEDSTTYRVFGPGIASGGALAEIQAPYSASLDAALGLVPEGWRWSLDYTQRPPYQDCGCASLFAPGSGFHPADVPEVYAATPALALCIAALRAREARDADPR